MTGAHFAGSATTCRAAASPAASPLSLAANSLATWVSSTALGSLGRVIGSVLLVPRLNPSLPERGAGQRRGADPRAVPSAETSVGYFSETQFGEFRGSASQVTGRITFESQSPARAQVSVSVTPQALRGDTAACGPHLDDPLPKVKRFPPVTLLAREFRLSPQTHGTGGAGVLAGTLEFYGVKRPVNIPITFTIDGAVLQGQGHFSLDLTDFGVTPPRLRGLEVGSDITIEVYLLAARR